MPERSHAARPSHDRLHGHPHPGVCAQLGSVAHERDDVAAARWRTRVYDTFSPDQLFCVDESAATAIAAQEESVRSRLTFYSSCIRSVVCSMARTLRVMLEL